jgi:hypothetical protein
MRSPSQKTQRNLTPSAIKFRIKLYVSPTLLKLNYTSRSIKNTFRSPLRNVFNLLVISLLQIWQVSFQISAVPTFETALERHPPEVL